MSSTSPKGPLRGAGQLVVGDVAGGGGEVDRALGGVEDLDVVLGRGEGEVDAAPGVGVRVVDGDDGGSDAEHPSGPLMAVHDGCIMVGR